MTIKVNVLSVDGCEQHGEFMLLEEARAFALKWLGGSWVVESDYAISGDNVCRVWCEGVDVYELLDEATPAEKLAHFYEQWRQAWNRSQKTT